MEQARPLPRNSHKEPAARAEFKPLVLSRSNSETDIAQSGTSSSSPLEWNAKGFPPDSQQRPILGWDQKSAGHRSQLPIGTQARPRRNTFHCEDDTSAQHQVDAPVQQRKGRFMIKTVSQSEEDSPPLVSPRNKRTSILLVKGKTEKDQAHGLSIQTEVEGGEEVAACKRGRFLVRPVSTSHALVAKRDSSRPPIKKTVSMSPKSPPWGSSPTNRDAGAGGESSDPSGDRFDLLLAQNKMLMMRMMALEKGIGDLKTDEGKASPHGHSPAPLPTSATPTLQLDSAAPSASACHSLVKLQGLLDKMKDEIDDAKYRCNSQEVELKALRQKNRSLGEKLKKEKQDKDRLQAKLDEIKPKIETRAVKGMPPAAPSTQAPPPPGQAPASQAGPRNKPPSPRRHSQPVSVGRPQQQAEPPVRSPLQRLSMASTDPRMPPYQGATQPRSQMQVLQPGVYTSGSSLLMPNQGMSMQQVRQPKSLPCSPHENVPVDQASSQASGTQGTAGMDICQMPGAQGVPGAGGPPVDILQIPLPNPSASGAATGTRDMSQGTHQVPVDANSIQPRSNLPAGLIKHQILQPQQQQQQQQQTEQQAIRRVSSTMSAAMAISQMGQL
ncbi:unnamed protein product [Chrysoparadoxa australica]